MNQSKILILHIVLIIVYVVSILTIHLKLHKLKNCSMVKLAGDEGENDAFDIIQSVLHKDDILFRNVKISFDGMETELDNIIVNSFGVFIIEVKSYVGRISGNEDDFEWTKEKMSDSGKMYINPVKNPIKQVKRQVYILANYLKGHDVNVWVSGNVFMTHGNSPVKSTFILAGPEDIDRVIHCQGKAKNSDENIKKIKKLFLRKSPFPANNPNNHTKQNKTPSL